MWRMGMPRVVFGRPSPVGPWLPLYSRFYSKMAAVEASTAHTVCLTAMYTLQPLQRCRALQLYSRSTVYILYTTPLLLLFFPS